MVVAYRPNVRGTFAAMLALTAMGLLGPGPAGVWGQNTSQDFSAVFADAPPPQEIRLDQNGSDPPAGISNEDAWSGNFLRLTQEVNSQSNHAAWNQVYSGDYQLLQIDVDFRMSPGNNGGADGIGIAYLNSANFGADTNATTPSWQPEEPNLAGSFGVGFDSWDNNDGGENTVSLHWDQTTLISEPIDFEPDIFTFEDGIERTATILVEPSGGGSNVMVSITEDGVGTITPINEFVNGLLPYDGRLAVAGRTGGANSNQDIDNLRLTITPVGGNPTEVLFEQFNEIPPPPELPEPQLLGGTLFSPEQFGTPPGPTVTQGNGPAATDGFLRLASQVGSQNNSVAFDKTADQLGDTVTAEFDFRILDEFNASGSADGMSVLLVPTDLYGDSGPLPQAVSEEPGLAGALGIGFDTYDNDEEGAFDPDGCGDGGACADRRANHLSLYWDGQMLGDIVMIDPAEFDLVNDHWNHATVTLEQVPDGANVTVVLQDGADGTEVMPLDQEFVEGLAFPESARIAFAARTGGAADHHDIDNVQVRFTGQVQLQPGDADQNLQFDQLDLVKVQIAAKYLTGQPATWGEGDWNGAPGGSPGDPPTGDGLFNQIDIIAALNAGVYMTGPYGALAGPAPPDGETDEQTSIVYNATTGELAVNAPASTELTSVNIDSAAGIFTGQPAENLGGSFDNDADDNIFKATFGNSFGSISFGAVAQPGLSQEFVLNDLTAVGSLAGGGDLGNVDLIYVPEPSAAVLLALGLLGLLGLARRRR